MKTHLGVPYGAKKSGEYWYSVVNGSVRWDCPFCTKKTAEKWARCEISDNKASRVEDQTNSFEAEFS